MRPNMVEDVNQDRVDACRTYQESVQIQHACDLDRAAARMIL